MPTGKVKWYDAEKGFGFLSQEDGPDVYVRAEALPEGVTTLKAGTRVEFGIAQGRRGDQALQVRVLDAPASVARNQSHARAQEARGDGPDRRGPDPRCSTASARPTATAATPTRAPPGRPPSCCARSPTSSSSDRPAGPVPAVVGAGCAVWRQTPVAADRAAGQHEHRPRGQHHGGHAEPEPRHQRHRDADEAADHPRQLQRGVASGRTRWTAPARARRAGWWSRAPAWPAHWASPAVRPSSASDQHAVEQRGDQHDRGVGQQRQHHRQRRG